MNPQFAMEAVRYYWRMPFDNWRRGVDALMTRFG